MSAAKPFRKLWYYHMQKHSWAAPELVATVYRDHAREMHALDDRNSCIQWVGPLRSVTIVVDKPTRRRTGAKGKRKGKSK